MPNHESQNLSETRPWLAHYPAWLPSDLYPEYRNAASMFANSARMKPDAPAIHYFERTLTFGEVDLLSTAFAAALAGRGLRRGDRVALFLQNIPQFLIALLGTWKAGAIVVPLNPMLKENELRYHLTDSGARIIVCLESLYPVVVEARAGTELEHILTTSELDFLEPAELPELLRASKRIKCDGGSDFFAVIDEGRGRTLADPNLASDDIAFLTYTSGTTGPSKGAMNTHGNVVFNSTLFHTWMQLDHKDAILGLAPLFHITGLIAYLTLAMLAGIPVIMFYRFDPSMALRLAQRWKATFTVASITAFIALLESPALRKSDIRSLTKIYSGGAPISPSTVERFREATGIYIRNIYGLTETTSPSHAVPLGAEAPVDTLTGALSVGVPICNTRVRILDTETGKEVTAGELGEIVTKGPMVVPGYWHKPQESANAIREGWLHTGDVGKMDRNGWFYLVDRTKDMIIASGYKIWPREVEDVLYTHPAVKEACVIGIPDPYRGETVKAFVSLRSGLEDSVMPEDLIQFARARMAAYKYPRAVEILDELPKTATGKLLRRELRAREEQRAPRNDT